LLLSGKEEYLYGDFLGASPQTPRVGFAEDMSKNRHPRSGTTLFASFSGKEENL
jgi:hypothetical protein